MLDERLGKTLNPKPIPSRLGFDASLPGGRGLPASRAQTSRQQMQNSYKGDNPGETILSRLCEMHATGNWPCAPRMHSLLKPEHHRLEDGSLP